MASTTTHPPLHLLQYPLLLAVLSRQESGAVNFGQGWHSLSISN